MTLQYPLPDLLDRASISILKVLYTGEECQLQQTMTLLKAVRNTILKHPERANSIVSAFQELLKTNAEIWRYESDLRQGQLNQYDTYKLEGLSHDEILQFAAVGQAAVKIRETNRRRKTLMNDIADWYDPQWKDIKINHASESEVKPNGTVLSDVNCLTGMLKEVFGE